MRQIELLVLLFLIICMYLHSGMDQFSIGRTIREHTKIHLQHEFKLNIWYGVISHLFIGSFESKPQQSRKFLEDIP